MANLANLLATIAANVYTNHNNEVTAQMVKDAMGAIVSTMGQGGYIYKGVATTSTNPSSPDANVFYIATAAGTYTNFGGIVVNAGEVAILKGTGTSWSKDVTGAATSAKLTELEQEVYGGYERKLYTIISGAINNAGLVTIPYTGQYITDPIQVEPGDIVNLHCTNTGSPQLPLNVKIVWGFVNASDSHGLQGWTSPDKIDVDFTVPDNVHYLRIRMPAQDFVDNPDHLQLSIKKKWILKRLDILESSVEELQESGNYYVATTGDDTNDGSKANPFKTITKAIESASHNVSQIIIKGGDYRETIDFTKINVENITLRSESLTDRVRVFGSDSVALSKTTGYSNVYEGGKKLVSAQNGAYRAYLLGVDSLAQSVDDDYPQTNGVKYRLPYAGFKSTAAIQSMTKADALDYLDANPGYLYYDSANEIFYISSTSNIVGQSVEVPQRKTTERRLNTDLQINAVFQGIDFYFSAGDRGALDVYGFNDVRVLYCKAFGCYQTNFSCPAAFNEFYYCESADSVYDGFGNQYYNSDYTQIEADKGYKTIYFGCWAHDNTDDGYSHHVRGKVLYFDCLASYNGGEGFADVNGAHTELSSCVAAHNAIGFSAAVAVDDDRLATSMSLFNCLAVSNTKGVYVDGNGANNNIIVRMYNCITESNSYGYDIRSNTAYDAKIICYDCGSINDTTIKRETGSGVVIVKTTSALT